MGFFSFHRYRYGTMARRRRRSWLAKRAEPGTHVPIAHTAPKAPLLARKKAIFFICVFSPTTIGGGGGVEEDRAGRAARGCGPTPEPFHTTKICTTGMLFTPKAFQGSEKSTVDLILLTSYEVRSRSPGQISCSLSISVCPSVCR